MSCAVLDHESFDADNGATFSVKPTEASDLDTGADMSIGP